MSERRGVGGAPAGVCIHWLLDAEKCRAAELGSNMGAELHWFHDYQVLWLGCGFGSAVA